MLTELKNGPEHNQDASPAVFFASAGQKERSEREHARVHVRCCRRRIQEESEFTNFEESAIFPQPI